MKKTKQFLVLRPRKNWIFDEKYFHFRFSFRFSRFFHFFSSMDEEEDETSPFRSHVFDLSMKRSNSSPALPLLVNGTEFVEIFIVSFFSSS